MEAAATPERRGVEPGRVIGETFDLYKEHFLVLVLTALAVYLIAGILQGLASEIGGIAGSLLSSIINLIAAALYTGFVVKLVEDIRDGRRDFSAGELLSAASPSIAPLILNSVVRGIAIGIGFILLIVPGLILLTIWSVTSPAIVAEKRGAMEAFGRSWELVKGEGWNVFFTIVIVFLLTVVVTAIIVGIAAGAGGIGAAIVVGIIVSALLAPIAALVATVMYFDLGGTSVNASGPVGTAPTG